MEETRAIDDERLILAAGRGDRDAFGVLVERCHHDVVNFIDRYLGFTDGHIAEDLAQEVFLSAWKAAPSFRPRAKVQTWLLRIATNLCLNHRRDSRLRVTVSLSAQDAEVGQAMDAKQPDAVLIAREQTEAVRKVIAALPPKQRTAIVLRHFHELSYSEIAGVLTTSVSAVESLLFRARQTLLKEFEAKKEDFSPQVFHTRSVKHTRKGGLR